MEAKKEKKYMSDIHLEDYTEQYETGFATVDTMIFEGGRREELLNGGWHYAVDQYDTCLRQKWYKERYRDEKGFTVPIDYSFDEWPVMQLPCSWNTIDPMYLLYEGSMVFTRKFSYIAEREETVFLKVGAANYLCRVFLNGKYVGMHRGGSTPAFWNITEYLKAENRIVLAVDGTRRPEQVPTENTDWFNYCGVYRDIALIRVPKCHIKTFKIALVPDGTFGHVMAKVTLSEKITAKAELVIEELGVNGRDILLNGESVFLRGISCHEDSVENGKGLTREERIENIRIAKELGCNFMRLAHYPHNEEMAKLADELGLLLWEEIPVYWAIRFEREKTYEDAQNQLRELINRDWNRASVIIWSVGNENADTDERLKFMSALAECAHREDETRMVSAACLVNATKNKIEDRLMEYLDIIGINEYCGWYTPDFAMLPALMENSQPDKPVIVTEFGADALLHQLGTISDKGTEECQADVYEKQIATLRNIDYIKGMTPWILYDFRCPRRTSLIQKYYNRKGLLSEDKKYRKPAFYVLQKFYEELKRKEQ